MISLCSAQRQEASGSQVPFPGEVVPLAGPSGNGCPLLGRGGGLPGVGLDAEQKEIIEMGREGGENPSTEKVETLHQGRENSG